MNLFKRFIKYQSIRFPLKILGFTTLASVFSSAAIINYNVSLMQIILAFLAIMLFMYHIRVVDESRDFIDDKTYHSDLPIHSGLITLKELFAIDIVGILIILGISIYSGLNVIVITIVFFLFTTLAWKDFFLRRFFKGKNVLYHIVNSPQMIILQLFIFTLYTGNMKYSVSMWILVLFMYINIFVLEVVRKIKINTEESKVKDTYSASIGFRKSILFLYLLSIFSFGIYSCLMFSLKTSLQQILISTLPLFALITISAIFHFNKKSKSSEKLLLLSTVLQYVGLNTFICIFQL